MPILLRGITLELDESEDLLLQRAAGRLGVPVGDIQQWAIVRRSLDARRRDRILFTYNLELKSSASAKQEARLVRRLRRRDVVILESEQPPQFEPGTDPLPERPVIIGFGPAGMFAGLMLARLGYRPVIFDRGQEITDRHKDVLVEYFQHGNFNPESNLLFGEGGAGTYSDGKLYTRINDPRARMVLEELYRHGADGDILIDGKPHIGSDKLPNICRRIREHIIELGGEVRFGARLDDVVVNEGVLSFVVINGEQIACGPVLMGLGQSARDSMRMLTRRGVKFEAKPFQVGVRVEHPQEMVDRWQYGARAGHPRLPPAEYSLVAKGAAGKGRDVFSFCMCPGGQILPSNEVAGSVVTNGASRSRRNGPLANSGLVLTLDPKEMFVDADPFAAVNFLEGIERAAFEASGQSYRVPAQRACDFVQGKRSSGNLETSHPLGGQWADIREIIPGDVADSITRAVEQLGRRLAGFDGPETLITAPETRASSPIRMTRDSKTRESFSVPNLYPVGEGAGYAGGIVSAAIDGIKSAEMIIRRYRPVS